MQPADMGVTERIRPEPPNGLNRGVAYRQPAEEARFPWAGGVRPQPMRKVPPPPGR